MSSSWQPRLGRSGYRQARQHGVAVVTALLLTTLAVTIVASLFWQQQVQVRAIENQRMQLQKQWILRGALDWARVILRASAQDYGGRKDDLKQPWATELAETRLDSYLENGRADSDAADATITGKIVDAQSYLNLRGLSIGSTVDKSAVKAFEKLLRSLKLEPGLAQAAASALAASQPKSTEPLRDVAGGIATNSNRIASSTSNGAAGQQLAKAGAGSQEQATEPRTMDMSQVEDLLAVPGFTPDMVATLKNFVIILPKVTPVNVNTAPAEVLSARIEELTLANAQAVIASRNTAAFNDMNDFAMRLPGLKLAATGASLSVNTSYFIVNGKVKLNRAGLEVQALLERPSISGASPGGMPLPTIVWVLEN